MKNKSSNAESAPAVEVQRMVRHPRPVKTEYSCAFEEGEEEYDTLTLHQNLEVPDGDHWLIELNLVRWRSKKALAAYLRFAASVVEGMPNKVHEPRGGS